MNYVDDLVTLLPELILVVLVVALGVYPGPVLEMIAAPVDRIVQAVNGAGLTAFGPLW